MFLKGGFSAVVNELIGFRISRRHVIDITTEEFQRTPDCKDSSSSRVSRHDRGLAGGEKRGFAGERMGCLFPNQDFEATFLLSRSESTLGAGCGGFVPPGRRRVAGGRRRTLGSLLLRPGSLAGP